MCYAAVHRRAKCRRSHPRMESDESPIKKKSTVTVRFKCLLHVGHEPRSRVPQGFPPPPTILCLKPYTFKSPIVVKVIPMQRSGNQSANGIISRSSVDQ